jgi:hypothetical protein
LFNVVNPDTFNDDKHVVELFNVVDDDTFKIPTHETLPVLLIVNVIALLVLL